MSVEKSKSIHMYLIRREQNSGERESEPDNQINPRKRGWVCTIEYYHGEGKDSTT